jgi:hypothetical protein
MLCYGEVLSTVAFKFNLRRYTKGLRANLARLYQTCVTDESYAECRTAGAYTRPLISST